MVVMASDPDSLTQKLFEIMELVKDKPSIYISSPSVHKCDIAIPDKVLESIYSGLPDRTTRA
jgi:hypothetical protein